MGQAWRNPDGPNLTDTRDYHPIGKHAEQRYASAREDNAKHFFTTAHDVPHEEQIATTLPTETTTNYPTSSGYAAGTTK